MINLLLGAPGGGKSYEAVVYHILKALEQGRKVITNLPLNVEEFRNIDPAFPSLIELRDQTKAQRPTEDEEKRASIYPRFRPDIPWNSKPFSHLEDYQDEWKHPESGIGSLFVIDECHMVLPRVGTPRDLEEWYSMHRHQLVDVLLITQSYGKVNRAIIDLVQVCYRVRKNVALGSSTTYIRKVQDGIRGAVVNEGIRKYKPEYFKLYRSHTLSSQAAIEDMAKDIRPIWFHWSFIGAAILISGAFLFMVFFDWSIFPEPKTTPDKKKVLYQHHPVEAEKMMFDQTIKAPPAPPESIPEKHPGDQTLKQSDEPLSMVQLHIAGFVSSARKQLYSLAASQNGQVVSYYNTDELRRIGYSIEPVSQCYLKIHHGNLTRAVICDAPTTYTAPFVDRKRSSRGGGGAPGVAGEEPPSPAGPTSEQTQPPAREGGGVSVS